MSKSQPIRESQAGITARVPGKIGPEEKTGQRLIEPRLALPSRPGRVPCATTHGVVAQHAGKLEQAATGLLAGLLAGLLGEQS